MAGTLYIVPTPVGNLDDMTFRAVTVLKEVSMILAEDTRTSSVLMKHYDISTPLRSHHKYNEHEAVGPIVNLLKGGQDIALVSDAGTPGISDPGFMLARECRREGVDVVCLPGATAFVPALVASGLPCDKFVFEGFLPQKKGRKARLEALSVEPRTIIIYESPKRLTSTLLQLSEAFGGEREAAVCREISKFHETIHKGTLAELSEYFSQNIPRGEIVIVVAGNSDIPAPRRMREKEDSSLRPMSKYARKQAGRDDNVEED